MKIHDYLVIGSGCSGAMAAQTLVEHDVKVTMLDVGMTSSKTAPIPNDDFLSLRKNDPKQYEYFIGGDAEGVNWGKVGKGEQIAPPRKHLIEKVEKYIPTESSTFSPLESLGYGGLGIGWGLQCWEYTQSDLESAGLDIKRMPSAYQTVSDRIGISATKDDARAYTLGSLITHHKSPKMDRNHAAIYRKYISKKERLNKKGFYLGRTPLALITDDMGKRKKYDYKDMDYYSDNDRSAWRPWITIDELKKKTNFQYIGGHLVLRFAEKEGHTEVYCRRIADDTEVVIKCQRLILATSALGSARIVLRSLGKENIKLPILCNPYSYVPTVQPRFLGKEAESQKLGLSQLSLFLDISHDTQNISVASLYSYQSLMLHRIINRVPLNLEDSRILMQWLIPAVIIMGIHHPDEVNDSNHLQLMENNKTATGDNLHINYSLSDTKKRAIKKRDNAFIKSMRSLGAYTIKRIDPGHGASIHYAGTLPFSNHNEPYTLNKSGRLNGTKSVYVADSSGFKYLPAPGLTFSLMANAHITALNVLKDV